MWREADFDAKLEKRAAHNPAVREQLMKEPLFCFETAVMPALLSLMVLVTLTSQMPPLPHNVACLPFPAPSTQARPAI